MKLGSAFQKINFLRDLKSDSESLGRCYFPGIDINEFDNKIKKEICPLNCDLIFVFPSLNFLT